MALADLLNLQNPESGVTSKADRHHKFRIRRIKNSHGFEYYLLENTHKNQAITIGRSQLDRFRSVIRELSTLENKVDIDVKLRFKNKVYYIFKTNSDAPDEIIIQEMTRRADSTGYLTVDHSALNSLTELLFNRKLEHPNDILDRIVAYHKLFQFTFVQGSDSITSDLALRKDILSEVANYVPSSRRALLAAEKKPEDVSANIPIPKKVDPEKKQNQAAFKSRLAEKSVEKAYQVDFDLLFKSSEVDSGSVSYKALGSKDRKGKRFSESSFLLPIHASEVKGYKNVPFRCELSNDEVNFLRDAFLDDRSTEIYMGFEVLEAIFKRNGALKVFRFPLYYMRVNLRESNREIFIDPPKDDRVYINHLALANLVEAFSKLIPGKDPVRSFFETLLAQTMQIDEQNGRVFLARKLPFKEDIFAKTREIFLGQLHENGKGGILGGLKIIGIECDLESVYLYKSKKVSAPLVSALEKDLDLISETAHEKPDRFYGSLLGKFLTPEVISKAKEAEPKLFCQRPWIPGALAGSTRTLLHKLNNHNLVLLEGPPGTGKTFTIMNLFIHAVCNRKRILIVSDQQAAIDALVEKLLGYFLGRDRQSPESKNLRTLWQTAVKVVNQVPDWEANLQTWINLLRDMLSLEQSKDMKWIDDDPQLETEITNIDKKIKSLKHEIQEVLENRQSKSAGSEIAPKHFHDTTVADMESMVSFVRAVDEKNQKSLLKTRGIDFLRMMERFIADKEYIRNSKWKDFYSFFAIPEGELQTTKRTISETKTFLEQFLYKKPKTQRAMLDIVNKAPDNAVTRHFLMKWKALFPKDSHVIIKILRYIKSLMFYPLKNHLSQMYRLVKRQHYLLSQSEFLDDGIWYQVNLIHKAMDPSDVNPATPLVMEICNAFLRKRKGQVDSPKVTRSINQVLQQIENLHEQRAQIVKRRFTIELGRVANKVFKFHERTGTSLLTSIAALLDDIKAQGTLDQAWDPLMNLQQRLFEAFPFWICRKQTVPFLLPCVEKSFDLVIVDEATQCRVDDALGLLFRGDKLMVVGDEKQTVLAKNSTIDDYLFQEFNLDEHLRSTHARAIKGGGSNIFALVKNIKQAAVMLDEHYRCPPEIIHYSNKYVYNNELKIMKWTMNGSPQSVHVDYSEKDAKTGGRRGSGKYTGIDTEMLDRFLEYVKKSVHSIEKETGEKIDMEQDVAICYFLLKNEPYVKDKKPEFLAAIDRGNNVLDGAGAALQGKEREYMFFYWDIDRGNMMAFKQGDQPDKRKGELNVLMSRPKRRAYHYLHKSFSQLDHNKATITHFLWNAFKTQSIKEKSQQFVQRKQRPTDEIVNWHRGSGQLMEKIFKESLFKGNDNIIPMKSQFSVRVGNPHYKVDLMFLPKKLKTGKERSLGVVDLATFMDEENAAAKIVDYYFQLKRADPPVDPVFMFMHELVNDKSGSFKAALAKLQELYEL
ncbi:MAG: AAA domain-containing protein [Oligoflexales bacterium]